MSVASSTHRHTEQLPPPEAEAGGAGDSAFLSSMSSASTRHVIVAVGVLPPRESRDDFALAGVILAPEAAAFASPGDTGAVRGVVGLAAILAAEDCALFVIDPASFAAEVGVASFAVGFTTTGCAFGVASFGAALPDAWFSSVTLLLASAFCTSLSETILVGVLVKPAGRGRIAAGLTTPGVLFCCSGVLPFASSSLLLPCMFIRFRLFLLS